MTATPAMFANNPMTFKVSADIATPRSESILSHNIMAHPMSNHDDYADFDRWKDEQERGFAERAHDQETDFMNRVNEAAIVGGQNALRALVLINGAAAVAMLAFIGHLVSQGNGPYSTKLFELTAPIVWFAWGVLRRTRRGPKLTTSHFRSTEVGIGRLTGAPKRALLIGNGPPPAPLRAAQSPPGLRAVPAP